MKNLILKMLAFFIIFIVTFKIVSEIDSYIKSFYGEFVPISINLGLKKDKTFHDEDIGDRQVPASLYVYKNNNKFLFVDPENLMVISAEYNSKDMKFINIKNVSSKIGHFDKAIQLNDKNIVFCENHYIDEDKTKIDNIKFKFYDIKNNSIMKVLNHNLELISWHRFDIWPVSKDNFLYMSCGDEDNGTCSLSRYDGKNIKKIHNPYGDDKRGKETNNIDDNTFSFIFYPSSKEMTVVLNKFNPEKNSIEKINADKLNEVIKKDMLRNKNFMGEKLVPLSNNQFLFIHTYLTGFFKCINFIYLCEIENGEVKILFSEKTGKSDLQIDDSAYAKLGDEVLIAGGFIGEVPFCLVNRQEAFLFNLKTKKIKKLNNMNYGYSVPRAIELDENSALIYTKWGTKRGITFEIFKKGRQ